ncbi:hypothetical protein MKW98_011741, partial [Papaver atlanticum]
MGWWSPYMFPIVCMFLIVSVMGVVRNPAANVDIKNDNVINGHHHHNYKEALTKSILFFEGQRSGKLPSTQRMKWRKDSAVNDGQYAGVFEFADTYQGSYNDSLGKYVCPHYCDYGGYKDELLWAASWLYKASNERNYFDYVMRNKPNTTEIAFNWDAKGAGTNMLMSIESMRKGNGIWDEHDKESFRIKADEFVCSIVPESPSKTVEYSPGGLLFKLGGCNLQNPTAISLLLLAYARYLNEADEFVRCGNTIVVPSRLISLVKSQ